MPNMTMHRKKKMDKNKQERLKKKGWKIGTVKDFLELTSEEEAYVELRYILSQKMKEYRKEKGWTQQQLAEKMGSSQSRVAKMEATADSVSVDLQIRSLLALGASLSLVGKWISEAEYSIQKAV